MKQKILKLNKNFIIAGVGGVKQVMKNIFTEAVYPLDMRFGKHEDGSVDFSKLEYFNVVKTWDDWAKLKIRSFDDYLHTPSQRIRIPSVVVCADYDKITIKRAVFPTKENIWRRDKYTCCYTGKKLSKKELTVDHVLPKALGGSDTWLNQVTCHKDVNHRKGHKTLEEAKLKLKIKPFKPKFGYDHFVLDNFREEWQHFVQ